MASLWCRLKEVENEKAGVGAASLILEPTSQVRLEARNSALESRFPTLIWSWWRRAFQSGKVSAPQRQGGTASISMRAHCACHTVGPPSERSHWLVQNSCLDTATKYRFYFKSSFSQQVESCCFFLRFFMIGPRMIWIIASVALTPRLMQR